MDLDTDVLAVATNAGTGKKRLGKKPRGKGRRSQRLRQEKGVARALLVGGRTEKKVEKSKAKGKKVRERRVDWDGLNVAIGEKSLPKKKIKRLDNWKGATADRAGSEGKDVAMEGEENATDKKAEVS
ncbi:MAG: hypothetical protein Q9167_005563 [Letrouitia subvulpina]